MAAVTVSPRFQVVIPQLIRKALGIRPGQRIQALHYRDRIELIPLRPKCKERGTPAMSVQKISYVPRTEMGRKLLQLRKEAIRAGVRLLTPSEINQEVARRRGKSA